MEEFFGLFSHNASAHKFVARVLASRHILPA